MALANRKVDYVDRYTELIEEFPLKPIRNDKKLGKAETMLHGLLDRQELNGIDDCGVERRPPEPDRVSDALSPSIVCGL